MAEFDPALLLAPFLLFMLALGVISWIAMLGGSLQFSLWLLLDHPPGFLKSLLMAILIAVINVTVFVGFFLVLGPQPWYIVACYQAMLQVFLVMLFVRCNPVSAFFAAFAHSIFSTIGTIVLLVGLFLICGSSLGSLMKRQQEAAVQEDALEMAGPLEIANPFVPE
jgi:hypothetical protein